MFTGLVQALGEVRGVADVQGGRRLRVAEPGLAPGLQLGESVSVCGACLTVVAREGDTFDFEVGPETLVKTTLGRLAVGDRVNLERALRVGDSLGGHFVTGHVDCVGKVLEEIVTGEWITVWFGFPPEFEDLLVGKGSVAVDGVSLTLVDVQRDRFSIMLIPHTRAHTTLGFKKPGDAVNLEFDLLAKHVQKLFKRVSLTI
ncbi:Riboflavin synthase [Gemmata sp. SH-PL17]|uniref:riboflavin synthase n=1 Tax=Gemmata sp. SH-PL17 TaxID=1630693 RepID=UPI00078CBD57|nr:riboflavin synthase [Gemmata sp. SH-PL17]AMV26985.1 Riboflavin synthase [Gemmata sp. SH-PL17]